MASGLAPPDSAPSPPGPSGDASGFTLHILCPNLPPPNRFTFKDLPPSTTLAALKARVSQSIPNRPSPGSQRLIYCGKPLANDGATLQSVLEPVNGSEYSMHLVLPPAPLPHVPAGSRTAASVSQGTTSIIPHQSPLSRTAPPNYLPNGQRLRYRGPMAPAVPSEADIGLALRRNIETIRRQVEQQERGGSSLPERREDTSAAMTSVDSPQWQRVAPGMPLSPSATTTTTTSQFTMSSGNAGSGSSPEDLRLRLHILRPQIALCEDQLNRGIAPPMDQIVRIRSQLFNLLDNQYQNPHAERDGAVESLLSRVFNIYTRADQLRVTQSRTAPSQPNGTALATGNDTPAQAPLYLLSSPHGYQALVSPGGAEAIHTSLEALRAMHTAQAMQTPSPIAHAPANMNQDAMVNAVRQAVINQRGANNNNNDQIGLARNVRRAWLFVRLFFFCYMFSEPGTWSQIFFVFLAALIALLSETSVPQQLYQLIVAPVQRHLEGLVHHTPDEGLPARPQGDNAPTTANQANPPVGPQDNPTGFASGLRRNLRRIERSMALFVASLVPGVGERHVEVRNAAEAARNAERAREDEQRRQQEEAGNSASQNEAAQTNAPTVHPEHGEQHETDGNQRNTIPIGDGNEGRQ